MLTDADLSGLLERFHEDVHRVRENLYSYRVSDPELGREFGVAAELLPGEERLLLILSGEIVPEARWPEAISACNTWNAASTSVWAYVRPRGDPPGRLNVRAALDVDTGLNGTIEVCVRHFTGNGVLFYRWAHQYYGL